ncbi:Cytosolic Fe-S cluster assembly factor nar1 [Cystobasidiomycetes sp. EMM_F5]
MTSAMNIAEAVITQNITPIMSFAPQSIASLAALHNISPRSTLRRLRRAFREILRFRFVFDTTFARHLSLMEGRSEYSERLAKKGKARAIDALSDNAADTSLPLLASACPGWICYAEKTHGELLPFISAVRSPQQVMGVLVKDWLAKKLNRERNEIYHVSVMPCYDKKLEASRPDFATSDGNRDVDCVLTTGEVEKILQEHDIKLSDYSDESGKFQTEDEFLPSFIQHRGTASGGYIDNAIAAAIALQPPVAIPSLQLDVRNVRGEDYVEYQLRSGDRLVFRGARCYGFRNLQNIVRKIGRETGVSVSKGAAGKAVSVRRGGLLKRGLARPGQTSLSANSSGTATPEEAERGYDFIELMACPSGCVNGGGQISPPKHPQAITVDREGMPLTEADSGEYKIVADESDGHRVLSGKEWVAKVENLYWTLGARKIVEANGMSSSVHASIKDYFRKDEDDAHYDQLATSILAEIRGTAAAGNSCLRTQYRAVVSEEVNGLAVKW